jgi:hypothetical protein
MRIKRWLHHHGILDQHASKAVRGSEMSIKTSERLTRDEMVEKYPDQWLFIVDPEINNETSELISGIVTAHSDLRDDVYSELSTLKGGAVIRYTGEIPKGRLCLL